eukprot:8164104-Pyramimonas_sp.AAC.2
MSDVRRACLVGFPEDSQKIVDCTKRKPLLITQTSSSCLRQVTTSSRKRRLLCRQTVSDTTYREQSVRVVAGGACTKCRCMRSVRLLARASTRRGNACHAEKTRARVCATVHVNCTR